MRPSVAGIITARGGSKGIPHKNILPLAGKPVIAWTIEAARQSPSVQRVLVSTDDEETARISVEWGAEVPFMRPAELAQDDTSHIAVMLHALRWLAEHEEAQPDYIMLLQPTSPLRTADDIEAAIQLAVDKDAASVIGVSHSIKHPYRAKGIAPDGTLAEFMTIPLPGTSETRRQAFPDAYDVNGAIYLVRREVLLDQHTFQPPRTFPYIMPPQRSLELDQPWDLYLMNIILEHRHDSPYN